MLLSCITVAFLGWIAWLLHSLVDENKHGKNSSPLDVHRDGTLQNHHLLAIRPSRICTGGYWVNLAFLLLVILTVAVLFCKYKTILLCRIVIWIESCQQYRDTTQFPWFTNNCIIFCTVNSCVFVSCFIWVWNLVSHFKGVSQAGLCNTTNELHCHQVWHGFMGTTFYNSFFDFLGMLSGVRKNILCGNCVCDLVSAA